MTTFNARIARRAIATSIAVGLALGASGVVFAQNNSSGSIFGQTDSPNATIHIENLDTGLVRDITPDKEGRYRATALPIGNYKVQLETDGKVIDSRDNVAVSLGGGAQVSFSAASAANATSLGAVTVVGNALPAIDVSSVDSRTVLTASTLQKVPVARNITAAALLAPGTVAADSRYGNVASFGGSSASENQYYINGFAVTNSLTGVGSITLPFDAIDQQQVLTGGYGPEYGRSTGGVVNIITKRGGNTWQGSVGVYWSPEGLEQSPKTIYLTDGTLYQNRSKNTQSQLQYSAEIGGPLIKDHLFAYFAGDFVRTAGTTVGTSDTQTQSNYTQKATRWLGKIDWNITNDHILELTGIGDNELEDDQIYTQTYTPSSNTQGAYKGHQYTKNYNGLGTNATPGGKVWVAKYTGYITDDFTINALYGKTSSDHEQELTDATGQPVCPIISDKRTDFAGNKAHSCNLVNTVLAPGANDDTRGWRIDLDYKLGSHDLSAGVDNYDINDYSGTANAGGGTYTYNNYDPTAPIGGHADVALPAGTQYYVNHTTFVAAAQVQVKEQAQYVQDRWQATDRWLVSVGLRNEQFDNYNGNGIVYAKQRHQLAPRLGATWDVFGDSSLKVYANAGRYHLAVPANVAIRGASASTFISQIQTYTTIDPVTGIPQGTTNYGAPQYVNNENGVAPDPRTVAAKNLKAYYQDEYILGFDQALSGDWTVGSKLTYRKLKSIIDDVCDNRPFEKYAADHGIALTNPAYTTDGSAGCFLSNPGSANTYYVDTTGNGNFQYFDLSAKDLGFPKLKRKYYALDTYIMHSFANNWYGKLEYVFSRSYGNSEGQLDSDLGQQDVSVTESWDFPEIMMGTNGPLPNDRTHVIKAYGYYQFTPEWLLGFNANLESGEPKSCIGYYPPDPFGYGASYFYCNSKVSARGSKGRLPYTYGLNLSASYAPEMFAHKLTFSFDVFNVLGKQQPLSFYEFGELEGGAPDPQYKRAISFQNPRSVRLGARYDFSL